MKTSKHNKKYLFPLIIIFLIVNQNHAKKVEDLHREKKTFNLKLVEVRKR